jgi:ribonuclease BN (tRNA processing enzyme)
VQLRILGSAGGWPGPGRPCSGYLLEAAGRRVWVDAGSGTLVELLRHSTLTELDAIWISHLHPDHCADLPMAWHTLAYGPRRDRPLPLLAPSTVASTITGMLDEGAGLSMVFDVVELADGMTIPLGDLTLQAIAMRHSMETYGLRAGCDGRIVSYTADSAPCDAVNDLARDADLFLCEAFLSLSDPLPFRSVMRPEDAGRAAAAGSARLLVLTHLHPQADPAAAVARAATQFPGPIEVAEPGRVFRLG